MDLSNLVHTGRYLTESNFSTYNPTSQHSMASSLESNVFPAQAASHNPHEYVVLPLSPPSPPIDDSSKCSLPSISSLLGLADGSKSQKQSQSQQTHSQLHQQNSEYRRVVNQNYGGSVTIGNREDLPPTPPMQGDAGFDGRQSPSSTSNSIYSTTSVPTYYQTSTSISAINNMDPHAQRQHIPPAQRRVSVPASSAEYPQSPFLSSPCSLSPGQNSYYPSPITMPPQGLNSGLYYQRPLPQTPLPMSISSPLGGNPWQHHHYISPSCSAAFPPSQDRYICQTCNKAFSRPSSLRIHSHSHTGEKPFKCPHHGCGKAFSVRSNMKRHERGCHNYEGSLMG